MSLASHVQSLLRRVLQAQPRETTLKSRRKPSLHCVDFTRFKNFLIGLNFHTEMDYQPLVPILATKFLDDVTPRLRRIPDIDLPQERTMPAAPTQSLPTTPSKPYPSTSQQESASPQVSTAEKPYQTKFGREVQKPEHLQADGPLRDRSKKSSNVRISSHNL